MVKPFIFIFPGQGSQKIEMGLDLYKNHTTAREVFDEVDESLKQKLTKTMFYGPESDLKLTANTQPALMSVSIAIIKVLEHELNKKISDYVEIVLGHSLGEYSALCSVNAISLNDTSKLLRVRGDSMQNAVKAIETKMVAIIGLDIKKVEDVINNENFSSDEICEIANDNCPGQIIISGTRKGVEKVSKNLKNSGARSLIDLNVSAPFHCSLMNSASEEVGEHINLTNFSELETKFISNVTADFESKTRKIKELLVKQIFSRVRWRESILLAKESGARKVVEIGSGKVLSGINKRIGTNLEGENISNFLELQNFLENNLDLL